MKRLIGIATLSLFIVFLLFFIADAKEAFVLNRPKEDFVTTQSYVVVSGETVADTSVAVFVNGEKKETLKVGASGLFVTQADIELGKNVISVKAVFPSGEEEVVSRNVYRLDKDTNLKSLSSILQALKLLILQ
ncbi:hypothetical protein L1766_04645 [Thermovorax subterraneus]|jgi:hypothetical protein|nr:hypothetical protein [Thermovorax subterraneus]